MFAAADGAVDEEVVNGGGADAPLDADDVGWRARGQHPYVALQSRVPSECDSQWRCAIVVGVQVALNDRHGCSDVVCAGEEAVHCGAPLCVWCVGVEVCVQQEHPSYVSGVAQDPQPIS